MHVSKPLVRRNLLCFPQASSKRKLMMRHARACWRRVQGWCARHFVIRLTGCQAFDTLEPLKNARKLLRGEGEENYGTLVTGGRSLGTFWVGAFVRGARSSDT